MQLTYPSFALAIKESFLRPLSGILLVTGTCVGAGMLALPVVTGLAGFLPAMAINLICCLFMMATGLLFLEATLWMEDGANVLSMAQRFLGPIGKAVCGASFIFLYYCLMVSYSAGGAPVFAKLINQAFSIDLSGLSSYMVFGTVFGLFVFLGTRTIDRLNWLLISGLFLTYILLIGIGSQGVQSILLERSSWGLSLVAAPILFGAYGYHNLLPSMATYYKRNVRTLRFSIIGGTLLPFAIYSLWQWMVIGSLSLEEIQGADLRGEPITQTFQNVIGHPWLGRLGEFFGFFALVTSFLGVSLSMVDFLADGLKMRRQGLQRLGLCLVVFLPPALFAAANPTIFIEAIGIAGGYGEAILNGLFPVAMVWIGRYRMALSSVYTVPGGRLLLILLTLMTLLIIGIETKHLIQ